MYSRFHVLLALIAVLLAGFALPHTDTQDSRETEREEDVGLIRQLFVLDKMKPEVERVGLIWKKGVSGQEKTLRVAKRATASIDGKLFVAYVEGKSEVPEQFRTMTRQHDVQALWIVENDGIVNASTPQKYLIENAVKEGIPLLAPTKDWVDAGAPLAIGKANGEVEIMLNEPAADATGLQVPNEYKSRTQPVVAAN